MRYRVVAVGKLKSSFYREACGHYLKRLAPLAACEVVEVREGRGADAGATQLAEGAALLAKVEGLAVVLDERGKAFDTHGLAQRVGALENRGVSQVTILVGGAEGHGRELRSAVAEAWSLSPLTLPHDLARLVLIEQLYRIETLRAGHPYHRG